MIVIVIVTGSSRFNSVDCDLNVYGNLLSHLFNKSLLSLYHFAIIDLLKITHIFD